MDTLKGNKLVRSKRNRVIAGVCGGLGEYYRMDTSLIRFLWVLFTLAGGSGFLLYVILWVVVPED